MSLPVFIHNLEYLLETDMAPALESLNSAAVQLQAAVIQRESPSAPGQRFTLGGSEGRHAVTVKRLAVGEEFILVDGAGHAVRAEIETIDSKSALTAKALASEPSVGRFPRCVVVQAIPKSDRAELAVDLLTQAGADGIVPWQSERTVSRWDRGGTAKAIKAHAKWVQTAIAAMKQSRRSDVPLIPQEFPSKPIFEEL